MKMAALIHLVTYQNPNKAQGYKWVSHFSKIKAIGIHAQVPYQVHLILRFPNKYTVIRLTFHFSGAKVCCDRIQAIGLHWSARCRFQRPSKVSELSLICHCEELFLSFSLNLTCRTELSSCCQGLIICRTSRLKTISPEDTAQVVAQSK